jgi:hypothetical protein
MMKKRATKETSKTELGIKTLKVSRKGYYTWFSCGQKANENLKTLIQQRWQDKHQS